MSSSVPAANPLETIRLAELARIQTLLKRVATPGARILEVGAGTGWQARALAASGYDVAAIDIPQSNHSHARIWPIVNFDGRLIPFSDASFDIVYSSNVLEHVPDLPTLNREMQRVLRPGGMAMHYVPTAAWRLWSLLAFYPALGRDAWRRLGRHSPALARHVTAVPMPPATVAARPLWRKLTHRVVPHAHGAMGSALGELKRFSRGAWNRYFIAAGWTISHYEVNGLCLSGDMLLGSALSLAWRQRLARSLGSTAHLYLLKPAEKLAAR